jgi:signal transduction histidine kinase
MMSATAHIIPLLEGLAETCRLSFELHSAGRVERISPQQSTAHNGIAPETLARHLNCGEPFSFSSSSPALQVWGAPFAGERDNPAWLLAHTPSLPPYMESDTILPLLSHIAHLLETQQTLYGEIDELATVLDQSFEELSLYGHIDEVAGSHHDASARLPALGAGLQHCFQADLIFIRIPDYPEMGVTIAAETVEDQVGPVDAFIGELIRLAPMHRPRLEGHVYCLNNSNQHAVFTHLSKDPFRFMAAQCRFNGTLYGWIGAVSHDFDNFFKRGQMRLLINTAVQIAMLAANTELHQGLCQLTQRVEDSKRMMRSDATANGAAAGSENMRALEYLDQAFGQMVQRIESGKNLLAHSAQLAAVGQLAAIFAHEIKQPLTVLSGLAQMAKNRSDDAEYQSDMTLIVRSVDRLMMMVKRFGSFSTPMRQQIGTVDLNAIVEEIFKLVNHQLLFNRIDPELNLNNPLPAVLADPQGIRQVVLNLVSNAIQAMEPAGNGRHLLRLHTYRDHTGICLDVQDTGHGIDPSQIRKVFDPYFTTKSPDKGTGLGLAVVKDIMEQIGGTIDVESLPGKGSCFTLRFPCPEQDNAMMPQ